MVACKQCSFTDEKYPPLAPVRLADVAKVMLIGENPSWEFGQRVPFDGITYSGQALHKYYIVPMKKAFNFRETDFWITDLFKCRYRKEVLRNKRVMQKSIFDNAKLCATSWLLAEIKFIQPIVILTLGDKEVYQRLRKIFNLSSCPTKFAEAAYRLHSIVIGGHKCQLFPTCHPDISYLNPRKRDASCKWSKLHQNQFIEVLKTASIFGDTRMLSL